MNADQARAAMVAFLDQFIARGAAPDVIALRDRLREGAGRFHAHDATPLEVFEAMRGLFLSASSSAPSNQPNLAELHAWTEVEGDRMTADPAQWDDWLAAVAMASGH